MTDNNPPETIQETLHHIADSITEDHNSIGHIVDMLQERGFAILLVLFAFPMAAPIPVPPGLNLLFAIPLVILSCQIIIGRHKPWMPRFVRKKTIDRKKFKTIVAASDKWMGYITYFIRPRLGWVTHRYHYNLTGLFLIAFSLCICIPLPATNTVPSFAVLIIALGLLTRDGLAVLAGFVVGCLWITLLSFIGIQGLKAILSFIF